MEKIFQQIFPAPIAERAIRCFLFTAWVFGTILLSIRIGDG